MNFGFFVTKRTHGTVKVAVLVGDSLEISSSETACLSL